MTARSSEAPAAAAIALNPVLRRWLEDRDRLGTAGQTESELRSRLAPGVPPPEQIAALGALRAQGKLSGEILDQAARSPHWLVRAAAVALGGPMIQLDDGGVEWLRRLQAALDSEAVWTLKPCQVTLHGLAALQEGLAGLGSARAAVGLRLIEAVAAHYTLHVPDIDIGARVPIEEHSWDTDR